MKPTKKELGQIYRQRTLELLARLGYATTRQIARGVFGSCSISKRKMIGRTLIWLIEARFVVTKRLGESLFCRNNEAIYALTEAGAAAARGLGAEMVANKAHGRDYLRHEHAHRTMCNSVFCALEGAAFSELEVRANEAPLTFVEVDSSDFGVFKKIPDLIAKTSDKTKLIWVEVENAYRSSKDLEKMLVAMRVMYQNREKFQLSHVLFVVTNDGATNIGSRLRERLLHERETGASVLLKRLDKEILGGFVRVATLDHEHMVLRAVAL
ncbi:hypothetical protein XA67_20250 [Comamonas thiooxydans]|uniref:replication-relaxation family protein n=1 Tax=Comamonas thiooxydans TaxID=363952 RepID=UPI000621184D|nr:replication-relaxation family protein [Comamonas thiooxydans]KKI12317.1 hypothetical protein XA67_20250 [Comamonas thiooxydans]